MKTTQSIGILAILVVLVWAFPWDRMFPVDQSETRKQALVTDFSTSELETMPVYDRGPCECCEEGGECCFPSSCLDLTVVFEDAGGLTGEYTAEWDSDNERWTFEVGACSWEVVAVGPTGGFDFLRPIGHQCQLTGPCSKIGGVSQVKIEPSESGCDFCGEGNLIGATIKVKWDCCYPEYFSLVDFSPATIGVGCDCSVFDELEVPLNCGNIHADPPRSLIYSQGTSHASPCTVGSVLIAYGCDPVLHFGGRQLNVEFSESGGPSVEAQYSLTDFSLSNLNSGAPITLPRVYVSPFAQCDWPAEITIQGHNCGIWCE